MLVREGRLRGCARAERAQFGLRLGERDARREATEYLDRRSRAAFVRGSVRPKRQPELVAYRKREPVGHDADDGARGAPDPDRPSDDTGLREEPVLPELVPDDNHRRRAVRRVGVDERPAEERRHANNLECGRGDLDAARGLAGYVAGADVPLDGPERADVLHGPELLAPCDEVGHGTRLRTFVSKVPVLKSHDAVAFLERQRRMQEVVDALEVRGAKADADCHGRYADDRDARIFRKHAGTELEVQRPSPEPRQTTSVAQRLFVLLHPAERRERLTARFRGRHAARAHQAFGLHLDVQAKLGVHPRLGAAAREQQAQPGTHAMHPFHRSAPGWESVREGRRQVVRSTASSAAAKRFQLSTSAPSARRPAAVRR
jgi:hypothetical protein